MASQGRVNYSKRSIPYLPCAIQMILSCAASTFAKFVERDLRHQVIWQGTIEFILAKNAMCVHMRAVVKDLTVMIIACNTIRHI